MEPLTDVLNVIAFMLALAIMTLVLWVIPIVWGIKAAKRNGISPHWMWLGFHPFFGWLAFVLFQWCLSIDRIGDTAVKWWTGRVQCHACGKFNAINHTFCSECGATNRKMVCPRCQADETQLSNRYWHYLGASFLALVIASFVIQTDRAMRTAGGPTWGDLVTVLLSAPFFVAATLLFVLSFSARRIRRVKCSSCQNESPITAVQAFRGSPDEGNLSLIDPNNVQSDGV